MIDIEALRADTPACRNLLHFNNAGASLMPTPVVQTVTDHLQRECTIGGYEAAAAAADELADFYTAFAQLLGAQAHEIAYMENATRAWDMAFYALPLQAGDRILTHGSEYASNYLAFLQQARRRGLVIDEVPSDPHGQIDLQALEDVIQDTSRLIALTHAPSQSGLINPAAEVGRVAQKHGLFYLLDGCQSVGQMRVDVGEIGCHILSGTGRKFLRGPRGTGFLYVSETILDQLDPPFIDLHSATWTEADQFRFADGARRFECWESYVAGRLGLAHAARYLDQVGIDQVETRVQKLAADFRQALSATPAITVQDHGARLSGIVTFSHDRIDPTEVASQLRQQDINISVTPLDTARLDLGPRGLNAVARASVHYFNTEDEIERFCHALTKLT